MFLVLFSLLITNNPYNQYNIYNSYNSCNSDYDEFNKFIKEYNRNYTQSEYAKRYVIFSDNLKSM